MSFPIKEFGGTDADVARLARLAVVGETQFKRYVQDVLPRELELDPRFRTEYEEADGSRLNLAFLRWQKRVFSMHDRVPIEDINWDGKPVPRYPGISYEWPGLYGSPDLRPTIDLIGSVCNAFIDRIEGNKERRKFQIFVWAEVYRPHEWQRPHMHTGAMVAGMLVARYSAGEEGGQQLVIEDPRGANPPFGREHKVEPAEGEVHVWPAWVPHYFTPNPGSTANVYFSFLAWPPQGARDFDWEDDPTGDFVYRKTTRIRKHLPPQPAEVPNAGASSTPSSRPASSAAAGEL